MYGLTLTTAPTVEPITLDEMKDHLRLTSVDDDTYILDLITTARVWAENFQGRAYNTQTWTYWLDDWPDGIAISLPRPPLQSVSHVKYYDTDDLADTFASTNYLVDTVRGRIVLNDDADWPTTSLRPANAIEVQFVAGYGDVSGNVPAMVRHAIKVLVAHQYTMRLPVVAGTILTDVPLSATNLLWQERLVNV